MDIRCENCQTEYELSEDRLKPEGVTVKCTSCGHMFRVRRRVTAEGVAPAPGLDLAERRRRASSIDGERTWLVRVEDGEIMTCRELATLQEWIAAGAVTRAAEISRTGKKWKKLGDIPELASFFQVADEAGAAARIARNDQWNTPTPVPSAHPRLVRVGGSGAAKLGDQGRAQSAVPGAVKRRGTAPARKPPSTPPVVRLPAAAAAGSVPPPMEPEPAPAPDPLAATASSPIVGGDGRGSPVAVAPATRAPAMRPPLANGAGAVHPGAMPPPATGPGAPPAVAPSRPRFGLAARDIGETGPTGGMARGVPTDDVAFAGGKIRPLKDSFGASASAPDFRDSASLDRPPRRRLGWIIALGSLVIIGGAVAVVYLYVFRPHGPAGEATVVPMVDAAPVVVEAAVDAAPAAAANRNEVLASARAALFADVALNLSAEAQKLAALPGADADAENLALRSRIEATLAEKATRSQAPDARKVSIAH
ncbi:MAG TPA: zinc-ribbon domain-containing protein, partial [Kofleriaceae bacterium]|nr:zinc-ribbon domain-containing protein [Kofleriaceae bacterium]